MTKALVLMKAMPPTKGHVRLIQFAANLADSVTVLMDTARNEPMRQERAVALSMMLPPNAHLTHITFDPQDPNEPGFWEEWDAILAKYAGYDYVVASEDYAFEVARKIGARYIPYDPKRELFESKAADIRDDVENNFDMVAPSFQPYLKTTVTVFGAESTGKTTLSKALAEHLPAYWVFEWARPYLETVGPEINIQSMTDIWKGQNTIQLSALNWTDKPYVIQDTDLYSTIGYWEQPHWEADLGPVPKGLIRDADLTKSDLYLILKSNIDFEEDPIRYGGDHRESSDEYWINIAEKYNLNYVVIDDADFEKRLTTATKYARLAAARKARGIAFDRRGL